MNTYILGFIALFFIQSVSTFAQSAVLNLEAEQGELLGGAIIKAGCVNASGDGYFVQVGNENGNGIRFSDILIDKSGEYILEIAYFNAYNLQMDVLLNGVSVKIVDFPAKNWCYEGAAGIIHVTLDLDVGTHSIALMVYNQNTAPLLDKISLIKTGSADRNPCKLYVSSTEGNDTWSGMCLDSALQTLAEVNNLTLLPGDSVLFKAGDTLTGQLHIQYSGIKENPIYFGSYGIGPKPVLDGANAAGGAYFTTILVQNQSNIEIANIEITNNRLVTRTGNDDEAGYGIYVWNNGNKVLEGFHFHNLTLKEIYAISTEGVEFNALKVAGIYIRSERNTAIGYEKHIRDVLIDSCFFTRTGKFGIWSQHAGGDTGVGNDSLNRNMNFVFRNNHFFETGGSGITPGGTYNCLVENNIFEYTGSNADPRMAKRGSGAWFFNCRNVLAQYNKSLHVRGQADSYGMHIDFGNKNVFLQYNYSEDSEGGFVEILGKNINSVYRFNISVNDGIRDVKGNCIWISDYAGPNRVRSDSNFIYNNTIYADEAISPDIFIKAKNTFIFNNIFCALGNSTIGTELTVDIETGSALNMSNNNYFGSVTNTFINSDINPFIGDPLFVSAGAKNSEAYKIKEGSVVLSNGLPFIEPVFPMAGKGIFKYVPLTTAHDMFGNDVDVKKYGLNIGAYNGDALAMVNIEDTSGSMPVQLLVYPNPVKDIAHIQLLAFKNDEVKCSLHNLQGKLIHEKKYIVTNGENEYKLQFPSFMLNGVYIMKVENEEVSFNQLLILSR